ncbi:aliphatic amidase amiE [Vibrio ishigakensis]|uniref:Aliphatic amidase amiE n=1 Tax=Vibrio ishigakensis TaxID=1481914 RepID=A0A0B8QJG3_9VIBR|nr:aliphatic amidase amiE [Vibrio ishigakensis]
MGRHLTRRTGGGITEARLKRLADELNIWLVSGSYYTTSETGIRNTLLVINPRGDVVARYHKMYPFLPYEQSVESGNDFVTFDVPSVGRFGVSICYDMWVPETIRALACMGAEVIIHPTMTGTIDREIETCVARANAITNQCYLVDINGCGELGNGQSIIVGPEGEIIHQAGEIEQVIPVELDLAKVRRVRERGTLGLGQPLKSFRDGKVKFPQYEEDSIYLSSLGELKLPRCS